MISDSPSPRRTPRKQNKDRLVDEWTARIETALSKKISPIWSPEEGLEQWHADSHTFFSCCRRIDFSYLDGLVEDTVEQQLSVEDLPSAYPEINHTELDKYMRSLSEFDKAHITDQLQSVMMERDNRFINAKRRRLYSKLGLEDVYQDTTIDEHNRLTQTLAPEIRTPEATPPVFSFAQASFLADTERKLQALGWLLNGTADLRTIKSTFGVSLPQLRALLRSLSDKSLRDLLQSPLPTHPLLRRPQYAANLKTFLYNQLSATNGLLTLHQLRTSFKAAFPQSKAPSVSAISIMLREMGITRKYSISSPPARNADLNKKHRFMYVCEMVKALSRRQVICIDETGINFEQVLSMHYAPSGKVWNFQPTKTLTKNVSCLFAVCPTGLVKSMYIDGSTDSILFLHFIRSIVESNTAFSHPDRSARPLLVFDNVPFHHSRLLRTYLHSKQVDVLYTPTYSPFLNPVEFANQTVKQELRSTPILDRYSLFT